MTTATGQWWHDATAAALLGTARRPPPDLPAALGVRPRPDAGPEVALLDAAALGGALVRAGRPSRTTPPPTPARPDVRSVPPPAAVQLLQLLLHQPPVPAGLVPVALARWLDEADRRGLRAPHHLLPRLLDAATRRKDLRPAVRTVADERGRWLATANPDWRWLPDVVPSDEDAVPDEQAWILLPAERRARLLRRLRADDPGRARALAEVTWADDAAAGRRAVLDALEVCLGPDDEELLERALDDRAASVRERAQELLDALPGSARAQRMAARLRPLLTVSGRLRKTLHVELPAAPDAAAVRDGLGKAPRHRSERGYWLERLAAGAPLDVWTGATGRDPAATWAMVADDDARRGILAAVRARRDPAWARALVTERPELVAVLPPEERERAALALLEPGSPYDELRLAALVPAPWGARFSTVLVQRLTGRKGSYDPPTELLARGLHPDVLPLLRRWEQSRHTWHDLPRDLVRHLSLVTAIPEAFR